MRPSGPPHYRAFRVTLSVVVVAALALLAWRIAQPDLLRPILSLLHLR